MVFLAGLLLLMPAPAASAQCGSQASSCKNCHETQAQGPVNNDGTAWHTQHQQIDACVNCHAGNPQSMDKAASHTGMVPWESDVKAGCFTCHPDDYMALAQGYATTLGVTLGGGAFCACRCPADGCSQRPSRTGCASLWHRRQRAGRNRLQPTIQRNGLGRAPDQLGKSDRGSDDFGDCLGRRDIRLLE